VSDADAERVARVVRAGQLAQGPEVAAFERELSARLGTEDVAVVSSGSAALELALRALGVGAGHEVIIPTYACDALYHAVTRCGAAAVLADADAATLTLSAAEAKRRLSARTAAVIVPHAWGLAVDLGEFRALGIPVIEDCAQALGAVVAGSPAGSQGTLAVCSFYATKLVTSGEGGAVAGPAALVSLVRGARDYDERDDLIPRFNYKLTDLQAALGRGQLARLDTFVARRRAAAERYRRRLAGLPCRPPADAGERHVYHRFVVIVDHPLAPLIAALQARGIAARRPVYRPLHRALGLEGYPEAECLWATALSLPCYPSLTDAEIDTVAAAMAEALGP
jgi:dTDP-4-amino-4,6-dideoxygalactose transaminase